MRKRYEAIPVGEEMPEESGCNNWNILKLEFTETEVCEFDEAAISLLESTIKALKEEKEWISVDERLPENDTEVLVCAPSRYNSAERAYFDEGNFSVHWIVITPTVTHWQHLPSLPTTDKKQNDE